MTANEENISKWRGARAEAIVDELRRVRDEFAALLARLEPHHLAMTVPLTEPPRLVRDDLPSIDQHAFDHAADLFPAALSPPPMPG